jgi:hypothetical protein
MPVWSKKSSSLLISEKLKYFNADELIEGAAWRLGFSDAQVRLTV